MASVQDSILSVFLDKQVRVLKDTDVSIALGKQGIPCSADDVRRHVRLLSPGLFQLTDNDDGTIAIRVDPKIEICEQFLGSRCEAEPKTCEKLHICRHFEGVCPAPNCRFPHEFDKGINRKIISKNRCEYINAKLLVRFLRFKKFSSLPSSSRPPRTRNRGGRGRGRGGRGRGRGGRGRGGGFTNQPHPGPISMQKDDPNRQVDVSFPSSNLAGQIDMEMIEMILNTSDINIADRFDENENEYFRRVTIQLKRTDDVEKLLSSPIKKYQDVDIKFKRTKQIIDKTSFLLQTPINNEEDKIASSRIELYVTTLIGDKVKRTFFDISSDSEQIIFVLCKDELDFDKIREAHKSKSQLSGKNITLTPNNEPDALEIRYNDENKPITMDDLQTIFRPDWTDIFAYNFPSSDCAEVEFINTDAFKNWISKSVDIQNRFHVTIKPIVDNVDEDHETRSTSTSQPATTNYDNRSTVSSKFDDSPRATKIKLREEWALIAGHPTFQAEYKEFIRNEFGGEIDIHEDEAIYNGTFPRHVDGLNSLVVLGNKTNDFMRKFKSEIFRNLEQNQVDILRANTATVAYSRVKFHDYLVAIKSTEMFELKRKVFTKTNRGAQPEQVHPPINRRSSNPSHGITSNPTTSMYSVYTPEQLSMFSIDIFENRLRQHLQDAFNVKTIFERTSNEKTKGPRNSIIIKVIGQIKDVPNAIQDLVNLFSSLYTKKFDDKNDGNWTKIEEATQIIQHHLNLNNFICTCQQTSPTTVSVHYFDINNPQFGADEQKIEDLIKNQFRTATVTNETSVSSKLTKDWAALEENIRKRNDYKQNICLYKESNTIYLFGLPNLVKEFLQKFQQLKSKHDPQSCPITLSDRQLNYLKYVAKADMNKLERQYKSDGCDVSLARIRQSGDFLAPPDMQSKIKDSLQALAQIRETSFEINEPGFEILVSKEPERLLTLVKSKCFLEKNVDTHRIYIPVPKTKVADVEDGVKQTRSTGATASATPTPSATSVNISHSTVTIAIGDLSTQAVDAIVACSSSGVLCRIIVAKAGAQAQKEYDQLLLSDEFPGTTSGGVLPCKKILFVPWSPVSRNENDVKASLSSFITVAFDSAISQGCKSLAFPAVGCGGLNFDPSTIAKYMLLETRKQLIAHKIKMNISFILLANQQNVYDEFVKHLNAMETVDPMVSAKIPTKKIDDQSTIPYDQKIIRITLISSNDNHLMKCKQEIIDLARSYSTKSQLINKQDMLDWSQNTINTYYHYCLKQRVIPTLDFPKLTLELVGAKDAVHEAEKYFYELTNETFKQARIQAIARGVIWSVELTPGSETWEQYSFKLNGIIEDAYLKKLSHVDFENEERCRIDFSKMEENTEIRTRRIRRTVVDSTLPNTWEPSDQNCKRVKLKPTSTEYQNVVAQFDITMKGKYSQVINIERIQNERWYKQYAAHREDFRRRPQPLDERLLFHGCPIASADQIIQACFNRSFAGINGVVYGCGVYFHAQASYSHQYAQANSSGERTMFLARVLIGKTCKGDKSMKVVPPGYDTTTDGQHIFVVYHDAGAYADHLITYK